MHEDLLRHIQKSRSCLTPVERHIADYITAHTDVAARMTSAELASACGIGESTVFRFCRHIGLTGYSMLRVQLLSGFEWEQKSLKADMQSEINEDNLLVSIYRDCLSMQEKTLQILRHSNITDAAQHIAHARQITLVGDKNTLAVTVSAYYRLLRVTDKVRYSMDPYMQDSLLQSMHPNDVLIVFSGDSGFGRIIPLLKRAKQGGIYILGIASIPDTPLSRYSDTFVYTCSEEMFSRSAESLSLISSALMLETLAQCVHRAGKELSSDGAALSGLSYR